MLGLSGFWTGVLVGVVGCYAVHHFAIPLPGPNVAAKRNGG